MGGSEEEEEEDSPYVPVGQHEALLAWTELEMRAREGLGVRVRWGGKERIKLGGNGNWRWGGIAGGLIGVIGAEAGLIAMGVKVPSWQMGVLSGVWWLPAAAVAGSFSGARSMWRKAREQGSGVLPAMSALCRGLRKSLAAKVLPNMATPAMLGTILASTLSTELGRSVRKHGKTGICVDVVKKIEAKVGEACAKAETAWDAGEKRLLERELAAASFKEAREVGAEVYAGVAMAYFKQAWALEDDRMSAVFYEELEDALGADQWAKRTRWGPWMKTVEAGAPSLERLLDLARSAEVPAWWSPRVDLPSLAELASKLRVWQKITGGVDEALDRRLDHMKTLVEGREIGEGLVSKPARASGKKRL